VSDPEAGEAGREISLSLPGRVSIREVGPRDGLQIEQPISLESKLALLGALVDAGSRRIEATAFVSPRAVPSMADAAEVAAALRCWPTVRWSALVASIGGTHRALAAGITELEYVVSAADGHSRANTRRDTAAAVADVAPIAEDVHRAGGACEVIIATAWDCPFDGPTPAERVLKVAARAVDAGADALCLADTIGTATPLRVVELVERVRAQHPGMPVGLHIHNTRGAGLASIFAAMQIGVVDIDASIGGLGGCPFAPGASGNVATEELAYLCRDMGVDTGLELAGLITAARLAQQAVGRPLSSGVLKAGDRPRPRGTPGTPQRQLPDSE
jgi:hydroxymethylglutaryl-CoA lyase